MPELEILPETTTEFSSTFRESIHKALDETLGPAGTQVVMFHADADADAIGDPSRFHETLSTIFGAGTGSLERVILQHLNQDLGLGESSPSSKEEGGFAKQVEAAKSAFYAQSRRNST